MALVFGLLWYIQIHSSSSSFSKPDMANTDNQNTILSGITPRIEPQSIIY
jgi:hypothetical protein